MKLTSFNENIVFSTERISTQLILETPFSKEIRIVMSQNQLMKEHQTPFPIVVHILEGKIDFGVKNDVFSLSKGDIITLEGGVPHNLKALENSIIRLTLYKSDSVERVEEVAKK